jgi:hypothetical protein
VGTTPTIELVSPVWAFRKGPTSLSVIGKSSLTAIGETSQLAAVTTFSDGAVKDVSRDASWVSSLPSVMLVSSTGLLTVARLGTSVIYAHYQTQSGTLSVTATPPGTFAMTGYVKEPGEGGVANGRVIDTASGMSTQTESDGRFFFALLSAGPAHLRFEKDGYEPVEFDSTPATGAEVRVQQVIRLVAGETVTAPRLAPADLTYVVGAGQRCNSCRLIRIVVPVPGSLHLHVTWPEQFARIALGFWVGGRHVVPSSTNTEVS